MAYSKKVKLVPRDIHTAPLGGPHYCTRYILQVKSQPKVIFLEVMVSEPES